MTASQRYLVAVFKDDGRAERAVRDLRQAGFTGAEIGMAFRMSDGTDPVSRTVDLAARTTDLPEMGAVMGAGFLAADWQSAQHQGVAQTLTAVGIPEEEARYCQEHLAKAEVVVIVKSLERYSEALAILSAHGSAEVVRELTTK